MNILDDNGLKHAADGLSIGVMLGTFTDLLPSIAAGATLIWTLIRIWETDTCKRLTGRKD